VVCSETLARRIHKHMNQIKGFKERKMFGGICFLVHGNMACGIIGEDLIVRVGKAAYEKELVSAHARKFDITGKVMTGWVMVSPEGHRSEEQLKAWLQKGIDFVRALPPK